MRYGFMKLRFLAGFGALAVLAASCRSTEEASLIVHHARIYTADSSFTVCEAMAIRDGKILATGTNAFIQNRYHADKEIDAGGKTIVPGLTDAHCHFTGYATDMWKCELYGTGSFEEIIEKLRQYAQQAPMTWIYGRGWDQNDWAVREYPDKAILDSLFPDRPVFLKRIDGHAALLNQKALDLAGIHADSFFEGGEVVKKNGRITGLLIDNAMDYAEQVIPLLPDSLARQYYQKAEKECFSLGLTTVHDCGVSEHTLQLVEEEQKAGRLSMKIFALLSDSAQYYDRWIKKGPYKTNSLHVGGFKLYADGALGSRGACLIAPYADQSGWHGFLLQDTASLYRKARALAASGLQLCTHAIGDSGNRAVLRAYASVLAPGNDRRWRIEHAQVMHPDDFHFFSRYQIIPSVQPTHATSDMYWAADRLGKERMPYAYAYKSLYATNGWMPLGTDFPVEEINPMKTFFASVVRQDAKGFPQGGFQKDQALSREQALRGMTIWAARAAFEEKEKGSLEKGKAADFVMLSQDLMEVPESEILQTRVLATWLNGRKVYER